MVNILSAIDRVAFKIGNLPIEWYGIILVSAMIIGLIYLLFEGKRINLGSDDMVELFLWLVPLAVIFARVFYVMVRPEDYFPWESVDDFVEAIAIWNGGITIIGAVFGGLLGLLIFCYRKRKKTSVGRIIDLVVPPLLLGQIIGRLGNFINQEAFGIRITNPKLFGFPFSVYINDPSGIEPEKMHLFTGEGWYAATCFYEMGWNIIGLIIAYTVWRKNKKYPGLLAFFYLFWYSLGRGMLEFIRLDAVPITQILCFTLVPLAIIFGVLYIILRKSRDSFKKIDDAVKNNLLYITEVSEYDVKNYNFAARILENGKNPLRIIYPAKNFVAVNIEAMHFIDLPKTKKSKVKKRNAADKYRENENN